MNMNTPKQFIKIGGIPIYIKTLQIFEQYGFNEIVIVVRSEDKEHIQSETSKYFPFIKFHMVIGGETADMSRINALKYIHTHIPECEYVLFHDSNRPNISLSLLDKCVNEGLKYGNSCPYLICKDTMIDANMEVISNSGIKRLQTPQLFKIDEISKAYGIYNDQYVMEGSPASTYLKSFKDLHLFYGEEINVKITTSDDLELIKT